MMKMGKVNTSEAESPEAGAAQTGTAALRSPGPETESKSYKSGKRFSPKRRGVVNVQVS